MAFTQITSTNLSTDLATQLAAGTAANNAVANIVSLTVKSAQVADSSYNALDDTAANTTGGYLVLTGTGFTPNCIVIIGQTNATSTTYVNTTCIRAATQSFSAATYNIYVVDSYTGATAIKVNGYTTSSFPAWGTAAALSNQAANTAFGVNLSANSDSSITYSNTTSLPAGTSLLANGYFYGTVSIGAQTTYSFDVKATDAEYQDATRTFSLTVTVIPQRRFYIWGSSQTNLLGMGGGYRSSPTQVGVATDWSYLSVGGGASYGIKSGTLWAWGSNYDGQFGNNTTAAMNSPVQIGALTNWSQIQSGGDVWNGFVAIKTDGTLWVCGSAQSGVLGLNTAPGSSYKSSPVQVGTDTNWSKAIAGEKYIIALKTNGTLWSWGDNSRGVLGKNDSGVNRSSPVQIGTDTNWSKIAGTRTHTLAIKTDGTLWVWGNNYQGQLGINSNTNYRSSPTQVGAATWSQISGDRGTSLAIKSDGTLWAWGTNPYGNFGLNDKVNRSSPVQIGTDTNWSFVASSSYKLIAQKSTGSLWVCGQNNSGQLGLNDIVYRSSPVQLGTNTNWSLDLVAPCSTGLVIGLITSN